MPAAARHALIRRLLASHEVHSQEDLRALLEDHGADVTQATLSRDLRSLGAVKTPGGYALNGHATPANDPAAFDAGVRDYATSAVASGQLIVLRTEPGHANPLAVAVDRAALPDTLGCIAGDDTVFVAARSTAAATRLAKRCDKILGGSA